MSLTLSFDIGHSSIGWGVLNSAKIGEHAEIHGCGSVIFPADVCLASKRRNHRRTRRNIRATRQRIARIKQLLAHLEVLSDEELNATGHSAPHVLAARTVIQKAPVLSWPELWSVIRWYAHNRGYDGNSRWARESSNSEDTEKEKAALELMRKHGTEGCSMAETICAALGVDPLSEKQSSFLPFKTMNAAFPRSIVRKEVLEILNIHKDHLPKLDANFVDTLIAPSGKNEQNAWNTIDVPGMKLPKRYFGGLLFGQLVPRFDNRIIGICPISGDKIPNKSTRDFLYFRWAMILANLRVDGAPLAPGTRQALNETMSTKGRLTATELRQSLESLTGSTSNNVEGYFELHPDSAEALILDPAFALYNGEGTGSKKLKPYWEHLPEIVRKRALGRWKKGRIVNLQWMLDQCAGDTQALSDLRIVIDKNFKQDQKKKKPQYLTQEHFLNQSFGPAGLSGRAPYSRKVMRDAVEFVLSTDRHPTEAATDALEAGPLYRSKEVLSDQRNKGISELTNNHLIRQRLDILLRLVDDILEEYADGDAGRVSDIVVEVASDLQTFSGLSAKEMKGELTKRLSHFKAAVKKLEKEAPDLPITGSLIRKCRIAMDLNWKCPFTLKSYEVHQLGGMEKEHIIPYAEKQTDSLDALVLTFPEVNRMKGKRLAYTFIKEFQSKEVDSAPHLSICTLSQYEKFVNSLQPSAGRKNTYPDDYQRQSRRVKWLLLEKYDAKDHGFTQGALTQTSHLNRLSARQLEKRFIDPETDEPTVRIHTIPGQVTAETRKVWRLLGTMVQACPEIQNPDGKPKTKNEIRGITHLHHALDAVVLGLTHSYLPGALPGQIENEKGAIWEAMLKRNKTETDQCLLMQTGMFAKHYKNKGDASDKELDVHLVDIPKEVKKQVAERLNEKRVVQHIPSDQSGAMLELNPWRLRHLDGEYAIITQAEGKVIKSSDDTYTFERKDPLSAKDRKARLDLVGQCPSDVFSKREKSLIQRGLLKITKERIGKLVGVQAGKLAANKSVLVISNNYGLALDPEPTIIPHHGVSKQLGDLKSRNGGKKVRVLRNGMLIRISGWPEKEGIWRISSCKAALTLDLMSPVRSKMESSGADFWRNVLVKSILEKGSIEIIPDKLVGGF